MLPWLACAILPGAIAQYLQGTALFNQTYKSGTDKLNSDIRNAPAVEDFFFPNKYLLPRDFYVFTPPNRATEYTQNVIFDPCRGYEYNCCMDTYGTPEYLRIESNASLPSYGVRTLMFDDGSVMSDAISRRPDDELYIDESCAGERLPPGRVDCVLPRVASRPFPRFPRCFNRNESVAADGNCRAPADGSPLPLCMEVGITQTAYVVQCGGAFESDPHCGTFLEIHRPGRADKLSDTRLRGTYTSGYRMTVISTTYKRDDNRVLCWDPLRQGRYELWWVQRTLYNFIVERRIPFTVVSPQCDWDGVNNRFLPYATLLNPDGSRKAQQTSGVDLFARNLTLFTRGRREGRPGAPGKGMGGSLVPLTNTSYPSTAVFKTSEFHNTYTYTFTPDFAEFTTKRGRLEPSIAEQAVLTELLRTRGYRMLKEQGKVVEAEQMLEKALDEVTDMFR